MRVPTFLSSVLLPLAASAQLFGSNTVNPDPSAQRKLNVTLQVTFPGVSNELNVGPGNPSVRLVNGIPTHVSFNLVNFEASPIFVEAVGGSLWDAGKDVAVRNLTSKQLGGVEVAHGQKVEIPYEFVNEMHPREILLNLAVILRYEGEIVTVTAYNQAVAVVEAPTSLLDPQLLFLYLILTVIVAYSGYFVYNTWLASVIPITKRTKSDAPKLVRPTSPLAQSGKYDESWIPEHHIKKPTTSRAKSGVKNRKGGD
ncbi:hypothetical protein L873DRAFT_51198 [Choiromyces venosus 120613-1]|uniref:Uncharacterized protein n=1 Tax=Choiromyces venosus 120613-1 TaxID=1336337 RepID=A0A3N4JAR5_9PEZI|nr:hypothetical protein L873DRAFT_51198 [Choiromyces venosus 120613-1]